MLFHDFLILTIDDDANGTPCQPKVAWRMDGSHEVNDMEIAQFCYPYPELLSKTTARSALPADEFVFVLSKAGEVFHMRYVFHIFLYSFHSDMISPPTNSSYHCYFYFSIRVTLLPFPELLGFVDDALVPVCMIDMIWVLDTQNVYVSYPINPYSVYSLLF